MRLLELELRLHGEREPARAALPAPPAGLLPVPERMGQAALPDLLRTALDGSPGGLPARARLHLMVESDGERFRVERGAKSGGRLLRQTEGGEELLAEGDDVVTDFLMRLAGAWEPLGRRAVVPLTALRRLLDPLTPEHALHEALADRIEPLAGVLGGRIRELLQQAHLVLRDTTEVLAPRRETALQPEDLAALREGVVSRLTAAFASLAKLEQADSDSDAFAGRARARHDNVRAYIEAERLAHELERRRHLAESSRAQLERARAAARLRRPDAERESQAAELRRAREEADRALESARSGMDAARHAHEAESARAAEREAAAAWLARAQALPEALRRLESSQREARAADERVTEIERALHQSSAQCDDARAQLETARRSLALASASPEEADRLRQEAARATRMRDDVARVAAARERLREKARDLQVAKLAADEAEAELEKAQREHEWRARSEHPAEHPLPALPPLVAHRDAALRVVQEESLALAAVREHLRQVTTGLGPSAYIPLAVLEAEVREKEEQAARFGGPGLSRAEIEEVVARLEHDVGRGDQLVRALREQLDPAMAARTAARREMARAEDEVPEALRDAETLRAALLAARRDRDEREAAWEAAVAALETARARLEQAERSSRQARERESAAASRLVGPDVAAVLRAAGFTSWEDLDEALIPEAQMAQLEEDVREFDTLQRRVDEGRRHAVDEAHLPSVSPVQAERLLALVRHAIAGAEARRDALQEQLERIDAALDDLDEVSSELEAIELAAGLGAGGDRSASFEERVRESLLRVVLARTEGRVAAWQRPWSLSWEPLPEGGRRLLVRDAETGAAISSHERADSVPLALALALEAALVAEGPRRLPSLMLDGSLAGWSDRDLVAAVSALRGLGAESRCVGIPVHDLDEWNRLSPLL